MPVPTRTRDHGRLATAVQYNMCRRSCGAAGALFFTKASRVLAQPSTATTWKGFGVDLTVTLLSTRLSISREMNALFVAEYYVG